MKKRIISVLIIVCMLFSLMPIAATAENQPALLGEGITISGNSVYRKSASTATVRFVSDTAGTLYYKISDSPSTPTDIAETGINDGSVSANVTSSITISALSSGQQYVYIIVKDSNGNTSNILTVNMPYDIYFFDDFEAFSAESAVPTSSVSVTASTPQMYLKYAGGNSANQKIIASNNNKVLQASGTFAQGLDMRILLEQTQAQGYIVMEADVTAISVAGWYFAGMTMGNGDVETRHICTLVNTSGNKFAAYNNSSLTTSSIVCTIGTKYREKIVVNLTTKTFDYYIDGVKANTTSLAARSMSGIDWFGFYVGSGTTYYDNLKVYVTPQLENQITSPLPEPEIDYQNKFVITAQTGLLQLNGLISALNNCTIQAEPSYTYGNYSLFGTGSLIKIYSGNILIETYTLVVTGDVNGDGAVDGFDLARADLKLNDYITFNACQQKAADMNDDGVQDLNDIAALGIKIVGD